MQKSSVRLAAAVTLLAALLLAGCAQKAAPQAQAPAPDNTAKVDELSKKLDAVAKKTDDIFKVQPKFAIPMREYGQRFANMYFAAKEGNWALAAYMMKYMKGAMNPASITKPEEYKTLQAWENTNFAPLVDAMEKKDFAAFDAAIKKTVDSCNGCHDAMKYGFVDYKLPAQPFDQHLDYKLKTAPSDFADLGTLKTKK